MINMQCYFSCLTGSGIIFPIIGLITLTIICSIFFLYKRKYESLLGSQTFMTAIIGLNIFSMTCDMFQWLWIYLGIILIGIILMGMAKHYITMQLCYNTLQQLPLISDLENIFKVPISVIDSQKIKAFTFQKKIYLSIGLLERLNKDEIKAVVAHELYHVHHSPNKFLSSFLALTSLTFHRYSDEHHADRYAAKIAGFHHLINALMKLEIKDYEKRAQKLFS